MERYYLYRHIRLDKNEPFYIGVGTKKLKNLYSKNNHTLYERAFTKRGRNKIWWNIVNKTQYEVEVVLESDNYDFILQKEIEFVKLYGRVNDKTGILANLTNGGEGNNGYIPTEKTRKILSDRVITQETKDKISKTVSKIQLKKVYQYSLDGEFIKEWSGVKIASDELRIGKTNISQVANQIKSYKSAGGFIWRYEKLDKINEKYNKEWRKKK